jgi:hypothetical protein
MFIDKPIGGAAIQESQYSLSHLISQQIDFDRSHWAPPLLALRTLGQPSAIHFSITARGQRIKDPSLTGFGIRPESAQRLTDRLQQPISIATSSTDIIARWLPSRTAFLAF